MLKLQPIRLSPNVTGYSVPHAAQYTIFFGFKYQISLIYSNPRRIENSSNKAQAVTETNIYITWRKIGKSFHFEERISNKLLRDGM